MAVLDGCGGMLISKTVTRSSRLSTSDSMTSPVQSEAGTVFLRALDLGDLDRTLKWHNDPNLYATLISSFRYVSRQTEEEWLRRVMTSSSREVNLAVCVTESGAHVGNVYLRDIDWVSKNAALGLFIGESEHRGKGYGTSALRQMITHAFNNLGLSRIYLNALAENEPAIRSYQRVGFIIEGKLRSHAFKQGRFRDVVILGLQADEFTRATEART